MLGIVNASGAQVVAYTYDAWGKVLTKTGSMAATLGSASPFRYRGYVYDEETGLYYVSSRYYDPETCRFINADSILDNRGVNTLNLFAYCGNNPVNNTDSNGHLFGTICGAIVGGIFGGISAAMEGKSVIAGIATGAVTGAIIGAICDATVITAGIGTVVAASVACGIVAAAGNATNQYVNYRIEKKAQTKSKERNGYSGKSNSNSKKIPTSSNGKLASECGSFTEYVDVKSIVSSGLIAATFAPMSMGANYVVSSAFSGVPAGLDTTIARGIGNFAMGGNATILQSIIDLFC